jgi:hypothetical protein
MPGQNLVLALSGIYLPSLRRIFPDDNNFELTSASVFYRSGGHMILGAKAYYFLEGAFLTVEHCGTPTLNCVGRKKTCWSRTDLQNKCNRPDS